MGDPYKYFKIEAEELLEKLTKGLLALEKAPEDRTLVTELFRYAHTLKGAANVVKLSAISKLAHKAEDLLSLFRDQDQTATSEDVSLLLEAVTEMNGMVLAVKEGRPVDPVEPSPFLERLANRESMENDSGHASLVGKRKTAGPREPEVRRSKGETQSGETLRIRTEDLDRVTSFSNENLINYQGLRAVAEELRVVAKHVKGNGSGKRRLENAVNQLEKRLDRSSLLAREMNDTIMEIRQVLVGSYSHHFEKAVRDLSIETGKEISFALEGDDLLLDRSLLEQIKEPIHHMLRNSVIHGLESTSERRKKGKKGVGEILLKFEKTGGFARISCQDDGCGLDPEAIKEVAFEKNLIDKKTADKLSHEDALYLVLKSGLSSSKRITELSGRGVGMDVVKSVSSSLGGNVDIVSEKGLFTRFTLTLPLSINTADVFMVEVSGQNLLLPLKNMLETRLMETSEIASEAGKSVVQYGGSPVEIVHLAHILDLETRENARKWIKAVFVKGNKEKMALIVDGFMGKKTVLLKPLTGLQKEIGCVKSSTILENGDPAFVLSIVDIFKRVMDVPAMKAESEQVPRSPSVLVVDDSLTTRTLIDGILKGEGYSVRLAKSGEEALRILEKDAFDLALVDVEMPGMNGFELAQNIRKKPKDGDVPIVILSSLASDSDKRRGIEVGANAYIVKGTFDQATFLETVESLI